MAKPYPPSLKFQIVLELLQGNKSPDQVVKAYGVHANSIAGWQETVLNKGPELFSKDSAIAEYEKRIAQLERLLGQKEVELRC